MPAEHRNPVKDQVAIVGLGTTEYSRALENRSAASFAVEAGQAAIRDAGIRRDDVDGLCGSIVPTKQMQSALAIPDVTWWSDVLPPFGLHVVEAVNAIFSGACTTVLAYHASYRGPNASRSAAGDPFRRRNSNLDSHAGERRPEDPSGPYGYAGWAARYLHEFDTGREALGRIVINSRSNAAANPHAVYRSPLSMADYLAARMVREPLSMLDMDVPVDGGDAFVLTTAERAADLCERPVLVHATTYGRTHRPHADQLPAYTETGKEIVARALWAKSDLALADVDIFFPYDGFSFLALSWFEAVGYCKVGEAGEYLAAHWNDAENRLRLDGRVLVNTHGGSLSEGGTQGSGHVREAVEQLRGRAGERQADGLRTALAVPGGFLWNATGLVLRTP
jgi:acetyl-CoA acetyltransferase